MRKKSGSTLFTNKLKWLFICFLVLVGIFSFSQPVHAIFGVGDVGLFDLAMMQLDALDFGDRLLNFIVFIALLITESSIFVMLSAALLEWAVSLPINLHNPIVLSGWNFFTGLVNISFILIFVFIALAYILKVETFQMKKSLVRLIIVALLVNFSLVLVGAVTDIAQIFLNSFKAAFEGNFLTLAIEPLKGSSFNLFFFLAAIITGYVASSLVPYLNVAGLIAVITMFVGEALFGTLSQIFFLIFVNFLMGIIFLFYFVLFIGRIVAIWLLAIFSPLAFFAYILPQTKKYASMWFRVLLEWAFLGVIAFLLLGLGVKLAFSTEVLNTEGISFGITWFPAFGLNYLFLSIYLVIAFYVSTKFVPTGVAEASKASGGALPTVRKGIQRAKTEIFKGRTGIRLEKAGERFSQVPTYRGILEKEMPEAKGIARVKVAGKAVTAGAFGWGVRALGRKMISTAQETRRTEIAKAEEKFKGKSLGLKKEAIMNFATNRTNAVEALRAAIKEKQLEKLKKSGVSNEQIKEIMAEALDIAPEKFADFRNAKPRIAEEIIKDKVRKIEEMVEKGKLRTAKIFSKDLIFKIIRAGLEFTEKDLKKYDSLSDKIYAELKPEKISLLDEEELEYLAKQQNARAPAHKYWTGRHWQEALKSKREKFSDPAQEEINRRGKKWYKNNNAVLDKFFESSPGRAAGFGYTEEAKEKEPGETILPQVRLDLIDMQSKIKHLAETIEKEGKSSKKIRGTGRHKTKRGWQKNKQKK